VNEGEGEEGEGEGEGGKWSTGENEKSSCIDESVAVGLDCTIVKSWLSWLM
jgi:hypothetical protein